MWRGNIGFTLLLALAQATQASDEFTQSRALPWYQGPVDSHLWLEAGFGAEVEPDYVGSDDYDIGPEVDLVLYYKPSDKYRFALTPITLGFVWTPDERKLLQVVIEAEDGRESSESKDLSKLPDGKDTVEAELTFGHRLGSSAFAYATYQPEIQDRGKGQVYFVGAGKVWDLDSPWLLTGSVDLSWGDREHMQTEFGVSEADSNVLGVAPYDLGGGLKSSTINLFAERPIGKRWRLNLDASLENYFSNASDSPLLNELGAKTTYEIEMSLVYTF